ncbi:MAG: hypothetical protein WD711_08350 [Dongiaceae bacterium]
MVVHSLLLGLIRFAALLLPDSNMPLRNGPNRSRYSGFAALPVKFGAGLSCTRELPST